MAQKRKRSSGDGTVRPPPLLIVRLLMVAAITVSSYLLWTSLTGNAVPGCGPESGCNEVLKSRWAVWFGIPVSALALLAYLTVLGASFCLKPGTPAGLQQRAWTALLPTAWCILLAGGWFILLQAFVLKTICPFCMTTHALGMIGAGLALFSAPFKPQSEQSRDRNRQTFLSPNASKRLFFIGLTGFIGLVAGQAIYRPPQYATSTVTPGPNPSKATNAASPVSPVSPRPDPASPDRKLNVFDGRIVLSLKEVPMIGLTTTTTTNIILSLFDYTCHFCRLLHPRLVQLQNTFSNQLAIVNLPMPLDERCNPAIQKGGTGRDHQQSCDYARLGLAVWRAGREKMHQYDDWFFEPEHPPPLNEAIAHAKQLVGTNAFENAMKDPWISQQLSNSIAIYGIPFRELGQGTMPQLIIGNSITTGTPEMPELLEIVKKHFELSPIVPSLPSLPPR